MVPALIPALRGYTFATFRADFLAGITVAMVALPLSLAIAIASGADPGTGLVTAIVAGFLISALGGSRVQIGGPTGAFIVVVHGVIAAHGFDGLVLATLMAGVILMAAGFLKAGALVRYVPEAVINGFTIGIAIIIATSQIPDLLGLDGRRLAAEVPAKLAGIWEMRGEVIGAAVFVGVGSMLLITTFRRLAPKWPGLIVAVALASLAAWALSLNVSTIESRFGALPTTLPVPRLPEISAERLVTLLPSALIIAFLAGIESLLSAMVADRMTKGPPHQPNAEIFAQGVANTASALVMGLPATGAIARTATNIRAGGVTPVAGLVHALTVLAMMMLFAPLAGQMAMPALAGLLILTAWNMAEPHNWPSYLRAPKGDRWVMLTTLLLTVLTDLTVAIAVGTALGLAVRMKRKGVQPPSWSPPER
ncbi:MAG TPA: sulfate permease [Rhodobacteraceae bacterium]|mgnify:FL=1|jgi:SulP family sulfate permease|nr:sulfate permease [Paracoccaceae bacterium]HBV54549.1 sulfate permease [Paracoccaceae bacterium]